MQKENLLIVDDNLDMLELLSRNLRSMDFHAYKASTLSEAVNILGFAKIDLIITDLQMPGGGGLELLEYVQENCPGIPSLIITGFPSVSTAMKASRLGAVEYLTKPFTAEEFKKNIFSILETTASERQTESIKPSKPQSYAGMAGSSETLEKMTDVISRVKDNRATVLIKGESGTGKELIARAIHFSGAFRTAPFIAVNCAAIPETLIESELFGHVKGAFSGAEKTREGLFASANGGTIFLDEIGSISSNLQSRLLRVLQEREVRKIGASHSEKINVRVISATNADLENLVREQKFREDLYYRLNVVTIEAVPLRKRKEDIPVLSDAFLKKYGREYGKPDIAMTEEALARLVAHSWPGNVRELENTIQRLIIMSDNTIEAKDVFLGSETFSNDQDMGLLPLQSVEKAHILKVLSAVNNNKTKAAEILQINRKTLGAKLAD